MIQRMLKANNSKANEIDWNLRNIKKSEIRNQKTFIRYIYSKAKVIT